MQRYFSNEIKNNVLTLSKEDLYHINTVMRMKENDLIEVVFNNTLYICKLKNNTADIIEKKEELINTQPIYLVIPLLKEQKMDYILQKATELNVDKIYPTIMERSVIKINDKADKKIIRWNKIVKEAAEQSKRLNIPTIENIKTLKEITKLPGNIYVCSTKEKINNIKNILNNNKSTEPLIFIIGPEGGISPSEEDYLIENKVTPISLGENILRAETAPLYILSTIIYNNLK